MGTTSVETALADIVPWFWRQILKTYQTMNHLLKKKVIFLWLYLSEKSKWSYLFDHYDKRKQFLPMFDQFVKIYQHSRYVLINAQTTVLLLSYIPLCIYIFHFLWYIIRFCCIFLHKCDFFHLWQEIGQSISIQISSIKFMQFWYMMVGRTLHCVQQVKFLSIIFRLFDFLK